MADLDVQPRKHASWLPWLIGAILLLALLIFLLRSCNTTEPVVDNADSTNTGNAVAATTTPASDWPDIDRNAPAAAYDEITNKDIEVRGNDNYGIYSLGENILFETDKATIRSDAEANLKQIAASINKRFGGGELRVYGYTDSIGSKGYNKELAQQRADAVKSWLATNGNINADKISLNAIGEGSPVAANATAEGRQQNRRVEVAARKAK